MELRQLEYLVAVAELANFTRAAERLHVAQPAVSAQIRKLERELGQPLLDRSTRTVVLTAAGRAALPHAKAALASVGDVTRAVAELTNLVAGSVSIGTVTAHDVDLAGVLADFHAAHPGVEITLSTDNSDVLMDRLRNGALDVAIVSVVSDERPEGLDVDVLTDEAFDAAVSHDDEMAGTTTIGLAALAERSLIALPVGTGLRTRLDQAFAAAGLSARIAFEASTPIAVAELAERGLGVAIVPSSVARTRPALHPVSIRPELRGRLVLAARSTGPVSPAAAALLQTARRLVVSAGVNRVRA
ncbi:LysR family transcriptional regulator [Mycobacterium yunnanensis]|uniref:Probable hydrogen peroxide-inducible genes activator n=1 Tax=Mycobacterium yunnanensis TaxID=368477 RepID=A0A9X3C5E9_9MYCO|nr:LysR family transcriptional regulator [Mycobacterium yunnanensis]MCV7424432.1 LysR family transcriptional regulator [Mycobacterium yunnanensis]